MNRQLPPFFTQLEATAKKRWRSRCISACSRLLQSQRLAAILFLPSSIRTYVEQRSRERSMAVTGKLAVKRRSEKGSRECRRLRDKGLVPGNMYGHKQEAVPLTLTAAEVAPLVRGGARVLDVELDGKLEKVLFREIQWDYL